MFIELTSHAAEILNLVVAFILPAVVALVTKQHASRKVKSITLLVLNVLLVIGAQILEDGGLVVFDTIILFVQNLVVASASYYTVLKPLSVAGGTGAVDRVAPRFGFGSEGRVDQGRQAA